MVQNADGFLKPGMFGHAQLAGSGGYAAMLVPDSAVVTDGPRKVVYVVAKDGTVGAKPVQLGPLANGLRVVRTGLTPDDRVIINGLQRARPGQKVTAQNGTIKAEQTKIDAPVTTAPVASSATFVASAG